MNKYFILNFEKINKIDKSVVSRIEKAVTSVRNLVAIKKTGLLDELRVIEDKVRFDLNLIALQYGPENPRYTERRGMWILKEISMSLEDGLEYFDDRIREFDLHNFNNLTDYDAFFANLRDMPSIRMYPDYMIEVLNFFIKTTPREDHIVAYTKTKAELIEISSVDLDFAQHFQGVGDAFQKFGDFLTQALVVDSVQDLLLDPIQDQDIQKEDKSDYM